MQERGTRIAAVKLSFDDEMIVSYMEKQFSKTTNHIVDLRNYCKLRFAAVHISRVD